MSGDEDSVFPGFDRMSVDSSELIGSLVRRRRALGLSQTEVAARMRTSQSALARLETGRSDVRMSTLGRYARALDADVGYALRARAGAPTARRSTEGVPDVDD